MSNNKSCAEYLKQNPAYHRCMKEFRRKWESYGRITGTIVLKAVSAEEKKAIGGIVGKRFFADQIQVTFLEFEQGLQKTKFAPIDMKTVLENYFGCTLYTNLEKRQKKKDEKEKFFKELYENFREDMGKDSGAVRWICDVKDLKKYGYHILIKEHEKCTSEAVRLARNVGKALMLLENLDAGEEILLAVLSSEVSGNPHYFDMGKTATQLLTYAVCRWKGCEYPQGAYEWRKCIEEAGVITDSIASMVHAYGVCVETKEGIHEAYDAFKKRKEPYVLTAENLKTVVRASAIHNKVYVVENEMVFLYLLEHCRDQDITCLCTSGQLRTAAFGLLSLLIQSGATIFYSGDLDAEGIGIADRLWQKYGDAICLWRMDTQDYEASKSNEELSDKQLSSLEQLKNPILQRTADAVLKEKKAGYQENILKFLLNDLVNKGFDE